MIYKFLLSYFLLQTAIYMPNAMAFYKTNLAILPEELQLEISSIGNEQIQLTWHYKNAHNVKSFQIQRSNDGVNFTTIGSLSCMSDTNTINTYQFKDSSPINAINYYRLVLVDKDNISFANTDIQAIPLSKDLSISLFPNPVQDMLQVSGITELSNKYEVQIFDTNGYLLKVLPIQSSTGIYTNYIDVKDLASGVYFVKIWHANHNVQSAVFIKQ